MCIFWSAIITRDGKILWDRDLTSHEELVKKHHLKDDKLENRDFVRIEITPKKDGFLTMKRTDWTLKIDEEGTLPTWYQANRIRLENKAWHECYKSAKPLQKGFLAVAEAVKEIKTIKYFSFKGEIKKEWHMSFGADLQTARDAAWDAARGAAGDAAWDAARDAARGAARDAARDAAGDAAGDAARDAARDAAGDAAWDAARDAAWDAAGDAARGAAGDAARDAAIYTRVKFCIALKAKLDAKLIRHAEDRMAVWKAGYGLRCYVNGKLYVYAVGKKEGVEVD